MLDELAQATRMVHGACVLVCGLGIAQHGLGSEVARAEGDSVTRYTHLMHE